MVLPNGSPEFSTTAAAPAGADPHARPDDPGRAAERLFEDYSGRVYRYCLWRLGSPEEAEDALQATYLNAWRSLRGGVRPLETRPWLFQIAANVCSTVLRGRLRGAPVELRSPEDLDRVGSSREPGDELFGLSAALEALPERQRHALLLRDWRGLRYDEIAAELDVSYSAVEALLFRARRTVAAFLANPPLKRSRARAAVSALLPMPPALSSLKSAVTGGLAPMKVAFGIALGATAPLIVFGLVEGALGPGHGTHATAVKPASVESAPSPAGTKALTLLSSGAPVGVPDSAKERAGGERPEPKPQPNQVGKASTAAGSVAGTTTSGTAPQPAADPASPPSSSPTSHLVVICHRTGSKKNPAVTISVAAAAIDAYLSHGDQLGACAIS